MAAVDSALAMFKRKTRKTCRSRFGLSSYLLPLLLATAASAHIGSPDIFLDGNAGPYQLFVTIRPPVVIPGVAELEIRSAAGGVTAMHAVPLPMAGPGSKFAPVPDKLAVSPQDAQLFSGALWLMAPGSWQVRITVDGPKGTGQLAIPVPSAARSTKRMQFGLGAILSVLGLFLVGGVIAMAGASVRESRLEPGLLPSASRVRAGRIAMAVALAIVVAVLWFGERWWNSEAVSYGEEVYKPITMAASVAGPDLLTLTLKDPGWLNGPYWQPLFTRSVDDFVLDHGHLMHLYALRQPGLDVVYHLHPELVSSGVFRLRLPDMPAGDYKLYGDVVHANGFPETLTAETALKSAIKGRPLAGDDATGSSSPWNSADANATQFTLPDRYRMTWVRTPEDLHARKPMQVRFRLTKPDGTAPSDMAFYMGMLGHAAFVKTDGTVFAHIHPAGSVSMAAFDLAQNQTDDGRSAKAGSTDMPGMSMPGMAQSEATLPNEVSFPYGFPTGGRYRIFIQMKHGNTVETGIFDASVK